MSCFDFHSRQHTIDLQVHAIDEEVSIMSKRFTASPESPSHRPNSTAHQNDHHSSDEKTCNVFHNKKITVPLDIILCS